MGIDGIENWNFHLAFAYFRVAAILQGVAKRAEQGNASSYQAKEYGKLVPVLARQGLEAALDADRSTDDTVGRKAAFGEFLMAS
jgi:aminoglycoside phosphotransferase (APT) family kinase protein